MNPLESMDNGLNLFSIIVNVLFGFIAGLILLLGFKEVIDYGSKLATDMLGQQMGTPGFGTYAPYLVLAPIGGLVVKQLTAVRSLKSFGFFAGAVIIGFVIALASQSYFKTLIS